MMETVSDFVQYLRDLADDIEMEYNGDDLLRVRDDVYLCGKEYISTVCGYIDLDNVAEDVDEDY